MGPKHGIPRRALVGGSGDECGFGPGDHEVDVVGSQLVDRGTELDVVSVASARPPDRLLAPATADDDAHQASTPSKASLSAEATGIGYTPVKHALQWPTELGSSSPLIARIIPSSDKNARLSAPMCARTSSTS